MPLREPSMRLRKRMACVLLASSCWACDSGSDPATSEPDAGPAAEALPADVIDVLDRRCHACHTNPTKNFAPFPLVTWQDAQAQAPGYAADTPIYEVMQMRIHDEGFPMPPDGRELTDADRAVLDTWIDHGANPAD